MRPTSTLRGADGRDLGGRRPLLDVAIWAWLGRSTRASPPGWGVRHPPPTIIVAAGAAAQGVLCDKSVTFIHSRLAQSPRAAVRRRATAHGPRPRGQPDRVEDLHVAGAAAEVARQRLADLVVARLRAVLEQVGRRDDEARRAEAALHRARLDERLLHAVQPVAVGEPLDRDHVVPVRLRRQHEARAHEHAVEQHRARAALALLARVLRARHVELLAQRVEQRLALPAVGLALDAVDAQRDPHASVLSSARFVITRSAWRR